MSWKRRAQLVFCSAVASLFIAGPSIAQCSKQLFGVPDFDQVRLGLQPNNGNSACVPASGANWLAYISNYGYPDVMQGPRNWQLSEHYDFVSQVIQNLAVLMDTSTSGTSFRDYRSAMRVWLDTFAPGKFTVQSLSASGSYGPSPEDLYGLLELGWLPVIAFGGYDPHPELNAVYTRKKRPCRLALCCIRCLRAGAPDLDPQSGRVLWRQ